jgi:hypothetical protein
MSFRIISVKKVLQSGNKCGVDRIKHSHTRTHTEQEKDWLDGI